MVSTFNDFSMVDNRNQICVFYGTQPMRDDKICPAFHQVLHCFLDLHFRSRINTARCFIQYQYCRVCQYRPRNGNHLPLPLAQVPTAIRQLSIIPIRQPPNKFMCIRQLCRLPDLRICRIQPAITDIFLYGIRK